MSDAGNTALTVPVKATKRTQMDREKVELLELIRSDPAVPDDYHPLVEMAKLANSSRLPMNLKMRAHAEIAQYITPKIRPVEPKNDGKKKGPVLELIRTVQTEDGKVLTREISSETGPSGETDTSV